MTKAKADDKPKKDQKLSKQDTQVAELTADLQRVRADFENYRKRMDEEKATARQDGRRIASLQLLSIVDDIERAIGHIPDELAGNKWANSIATLGVSLQKSLNKIGIERVIADPGKPFDPEHHEAVQFDDDSTGEHEVVEKELRAGYMLDGRVIRSSMVNVTRK